MSAYQIQQFANRNNIPIKQVQRDIVIQKLTVQKVMDLRQMGEFIFML